MQMYNKLSIQSWDENAETWDSSMQEGSPFQQQIVDPIIDKLIFPIDDSTNILEIGCGNGFLAKRLAQHGARVSAFDFPPYLDIKMER